MIHPAAAASNPASIQYVVNFEWFVIPLDAQFDDSFIVDTSKSFGS
jgi:hypothetical protein